MAKEWIEPMQWDNEGTPPSESLKTGGFTAGYKPPAGVFNYFLHKVAACIKEIQAFAGSLDEGKAPKNHAAENKTYGAGSDTQYGHVMLSDKTDSTSGASEGVAASPAAVKAAYDLAKEAKSSAGKVPTNHASPETTYGVSSETNYGHAKASSTTPKAPGEATAGSETASFAMGDHVHPEQLAAHGVTTAGTGTDYTATVPGIDALVSGATFIMVPHAVSTSTAPSLNVNSLGAKTIRRRLSNSTSATTVGNSESWLAAGKPVRMTYDGTYWIAELVRPNMADAYGTLPVANGGTGATTAEAARANLGAAAASHSHAPADIGAAPAYTYGTTDMTAGSSPLETGKLHFVYE